MRRDLVLLRKQVGDLSDFLSFITTQGGDKEVRNVAVFIQPRIANESTVLQTKLMMCINEELVEMNANLRELARTIRERPTGGKK